MDLVEAGLHGRGQVASGVGASDGLPDKSMSWSTPGTFWA
jgi:hypothetical protein